MNQTTVGFIEDNGKIKLPPLNVKTNLSQDKKSNPKTPKKNERKELNNEIKNDKKEILLNFDGKKSRNPEIAKNMKLFNLELFNLETRKKDARDNLIKLEEKKSNLNKAVKEVQFNLNKLEEKKSNLTQEIEQSQKFIREAEEKQRNLNKKTAEYNQKIKDLEIKEKNINRNFEELKEYEIKLNNKEKRISEINERNIKKEKELQEKEDLINKTKKELRNKESEIKKLKEDFEIEKNKFNLKSMQLNKGFSDLNNKKIELKNLSLSLQEQLSQGWDELEQEKNKMKLEKDRIDKEKQENLEERKKLEKIKKDIEKTGQKLAKKDQKINEILDLLNQKEKDLAKERQKLENDKIAFINLADICFLGSSIKNSIIQEQNSNPEQFYNIRKKIKHLNNENLMVLPLYLMFDWLEENGCKVVIEKKAKDIRVNNLCLQHIFNRNVVEKKFKLVFDDKYNNYLYNKDNCDHFINSFKTDISNCLDIPLSDIFIVNPRGPKFTVDLYIKDLDYNKKDQVEQYLKTRKKDILIIKDSLLLEGCKLSLELLEPKFDMRPNDWPNVTKRGNLPYYPPYNYFGFGLKVLNLYDNGNNTWIGQKNIQGEFAVAYHGIRSNIDSINQIMNSHLKQGKNQDCEFDDDLMHPGNKCGKGVYVTPKIEVAEKYTKVFHVKEINQKFRVAFQCRVNPLLIRQSCRKPDYWILNGNGQEIRPYRLLIKQENM